MTLAARQSTTTTAASNSCPNTISGGGIAGIVLGSIAGTLLLIWLWQMCRLPGAPANPEPEREVVYTRTSPRSPSRRHRQRRSYAEKPRGYYDDVRRPERVYITDA
jgi:hypothetical protein